jgi:hypothetical protein
MKKKKSERKLKEGNQLKKKETRNGNEKSQSEED